MHLLGVWFLSFLSRSSIFPVGLCRHVSLITTPVARRRGRANSNQVDALLLNTRIFQGVKVPIPSVKVILSHRGALILVWQTGLGWKFKVSGASILFDEVVGLVLSFFAHYKRRSSLHRLPKRCPDFHVWL